MILIGGDCTGEGHCRKTLSQINIFETQLRNNFVEYYNLIQIDLIKYSQIILKDSKVFVTILVAFYMKDQYFTLWPAKDLKRLSAMLLIAILIDFDLRNNFVEYSNLIRIDLTEL